MPRAYFTASVCGRAVIIAGESAFLSRHSFIAESQGFLRCRRDQFALEVQPPTLLSALLL
jgi:hypothetical protein